jgi:hypothetical protein
MGCTDSFAGKCCPESPESRRLITREDVEVQKFPSPTFSKDRLRRKTWNNIIEGRKTEW